MENRDSDTQRHGAADDPRWHAVLNQLTAHAEPLARGGSIAATWRTAVS